MVDGKRIVETKNAYDCAEFVLGEPVRLKLERKNVMPPTIYSKTLADILPRYISRSAVTLDLGCGSGFLAILMAKLGAKKVIAVDINPKAIRLAKLNIKQNKLGGKVKTIVSDLYSKFNGEKFDLIISNPPFLPVSQNRVTKIVTDGRDVIDRLILDSKRFMRRDSFLIFTQSSLASLEKTVRLLKKEGFLYKIIKKQRLEFRECTYKHLNFVKRLEKQGLAKFFSKNNKYYEDLYVICASKAG